MKILASTGGIGSGKSTVAEIFRILGIPVFDADSAAKELYETNPAFTQGARLPYLAGEYTTKTINLIPNYWLPPLLMTLCDLLS